MNYANRHRFFSRSLFFLLICSLLDPLRAKSHTILTDTDDDKIVFDRAFSDNKQFLIADCIPLAFGDFNADKIVDIFCRNTAGDQLRVMLNDDRSPTSIEKDRVNFTGILSDVLAADYDGDSKLDLFVLYKLNQDDQIYRGGFLWGDRGKLSKQFD